MRKGFVQPLILLILLVVLAAIIFQGKPLKGWFSNFQSPQADQQTILPEWQTYSNKTYGFSIQYPDIWYVREFGDYAAYFQTTDPKTGEATPGAILVKFSALKEKVDQNEFEKIYNLETGKKILEPLDVRSTITKIKNLEVDKKRGVEYIIDRQFSAPEGPRGQYTHVFAIDKDGVVLKFFSSADTEENHKFKATFQKMIDALKL